MLHAYERRSFTERNDGRARGTLPPPLRQKGEFGKILYNEIGWWLVTGLRGWNGLCLLIMREEVDVLVHSASRCSCQSLCTKYLRDYDDKDSTSLCKRTSIKGAVPFQTFNFCFFYCFIEIFYKL